MNYLQELYSFAKIMVCFSVLLFATSFFLLLKNPETLPEPTDQALCGGVVYSEDRAPSDEEVNASPVLTKGQELFQNNCIACHSVHTVKVGPALRGITKRRTKKWIFRFVKDPRKLIRQKDAYAVALYQQYHNIEMTAFPDLKDEEINAILEYIDMPYSY